jgi:hypothetical protein
VYAVRSAGQSGEAPRLLLAANIPGDEADPVALDKKSLAPLIAPEVGGNWDYLDSASATIDPGELAAKSHGLWDQLLLLALAVGLFEPWLANRLSKRRGEAAPDAMSKRDVATPAQKHAARPAA